SRAVEACRGAAITPVAVAASAFSPAVLAQPVAVSPHRQSARKWPMRAIVSRLQAGKERPNGRPARKGRRLPANSRRTTFLNPSPSGRGKFNYGAQSPCRRTVEVELAFVEGDEVGHDGKAEARSRLALVETAAAAGGFNPLLRVEAGTVVVDIDGEPARHFVARRLLITNTHPDLAFCPFSAVVYERAADV